MTTTYRTLPEGPSPGAALSLTRARGRAAAAHTIDATFTGERQI